MTVVLDGLRLVAEFPMEHAQPQDAEHRLPHQPVLPDAVVGWLQPASGKVMVDCTVGSGGHSVALLPRLMPDGRLIALDHDEQSIESAKRRLAEFSPQVSFVQERFSRLPEALARLGLARVDGIVADLGISSMHLEDPGRGFSFTREGPLDMRMDRRQPTTAAALIQRLSEEELAYVLAEYGQERWARRIAKRVVAARRSQPITTTSQLARIVADALPGRGKIHPATRTFQALRIAVNEELSELDALLTTLPSCLAPGGRAVLISFHSLEDRRVKQAFRQGAVEGIYRLLTKKPMTPSEEERARNPRSRSAKLRVVERCAS